MANPRQQIHTWLMQQQMPKGMGIQPGREPQGFSGVAGPTLGAIGAGSRFGKPMIQSWFDQFSRRPAQEPSDLGVPGPDVLRMRQASRPQSSMGVSEAKLSVTENPAENFNSRFHADQRMNGTPANLDPEANISEALLYAQNENRMAPLRYADNIQQKIRSFPVDPTLQHNLSRAVFDVYGPGYSIVVGSGGQPESGSSLENLNMRPEKPNDIVYKGRVGSTRHDHGRAADINVIGPDGKVIHGEELAKLGQYWIANGSGSAGLEMAGHKIHLDSRTMDELGSRDALNWDYKDEAGGVYTPAMDRRIQAGLSGKMPELYQSPGMPKPSISAVELGIEDPLADTRTSRQHSTFEGADPEAMVREAYEYSKGVQDPYREPIIPKPRPRPER